VLRFDALDVEARLDPARIALARLALGWEGGRIRAEGAVERPWGDPELALSVGAELPLGSLARLAGSGLVARGVARVEGELRGPPGAPRVTARVSVPELEAGPVVAREVRIRGGWADGRLTLDDVQARVLGGRLEASLEVPGGASVSVRATARLSRVTGPGALAVLGPAEVEAAGRITGSGVELAPTRVTWRAGWLNLDGRIEAAGPITLRGRLAADLGRLAEAFGSSAVAGRAAATVDVTGRLDAPALAGRVELSALTVGGHAVTPAPVEVRLETLPSPGAAGAAAGPRLAGSIRASGLVLAGVPVDDLVARLGLDAVRLEVLEARARIHAVPVTAAGTWEWGGAGRARADLGPARLGSLPGLPPALALRGTGGGRLEATMRDGTLVTETALGLAQVAIAGVTLGAGTVRLGTRGSRLEAELAFPERRLDLAVSGRIAAAEPLAARLEIADLDLETLLGQLAPAAAGHAAGRVSARVDARVALGRPREARATASVEPRALRLLGLPWEARGPIALSLEAGRLRLDRLRLQGTLGTLTADGLLWDGTAGPTLALGLLEASPPGALAALGTGSVRAQVRFAHGALAVTRVEARWPGVDLDGHGRLAPDTGLAAFPPDGSPGGGSTPRGRAGRSRPTSSGSASSSSASAPSRSWPRRRWRRRSDPAPTTRRPAPRCASAWRPRRRRASSRPGARRRGRASGSAVS
jgi:hypothetical protein